MEFKNLIKKDILGGRCPICLYIKYYLFEKLNLAPLLGLRLKCLEIKKMRICFILSFHLQ